MAMGNNICAMGEFPINGNVAEDREEMLQQFAPRGGIDKSAPKFHRAICHGCNQWTMVKQVMPRKGYFVHHKSSIQGSAPGHDTSQTHGRKGTPPRERGRESSVRKDD